MSSDRPVESTRGLASSRAILLVVMIGAALRLTLLTSVPPPLNHDEASRLYDAWSLLEQGTDRTGRPWPFFLEGYGEGDFTAALTSYLTIPFVMVLGPEVLAVRLPDALLSSFTIFIVWSWLRRAYSGRVAILAALFLAFDPWHVQVTRTGWEFGYVPFFLAAGMACADRAGLLPGSVAARGSSRWAVGAATALALSAWVYPSTRMVTPLLCVALVVLNWPHYAALLRERAGRRAISTFIMATLIAGAPLWVTTLSDPSRLAARGKIALMDFRPAALPTTIPQALWNYASYFDPSFLVTFPEEFTTIGIPGVGLHLWAVAPFMVVGLILTVSRYPSTPLMRVLLPWILLTPVPAAICKDIQPHMIRVITGMVVWPILGAIGAEWIWSRLTKRSAANRRALLACYALFFTANAAYFAHQYFRAYPLHAELGYSSSFIRALKYVVERRDECDFVLVTNRVHQGYIYALLYTPISPAALRADPPVVARGPQNFHQVLRVGRYYFAPRDPLNYPDAGRLFQEAWAAIPTGARALVIEQPGHFTEGELLAYFPWADPATPPGGYEVRRWRKE